MTKMKKSLAIFYALSAGTLVWISGCIIFISFMATLRLPVVLLFGQYFYPVQFFYLYFLIIALGYSGFLYFWLLYHPQTAKKRFWFSILGLLTMLSIAIIPCALLYELQDMLYGFYPDDIGKKLFSYWRNWFFVGWVMLIFSFPISIPALVGFFFINNFCVKRFEQQYRPRLYQWLSECRSKHPRKFFFISGVILFVIALGCNMWAFDYDDEANYWHYIYIPQGHLNPWFFIGFPFVVLLASIPAGVCFLLRSINQKLAWWVMILGSLSFMLWSIWQALPQNVFIRVMGENYRQSMRLQTLRTNFYFNNSGNTVTGSFSCSAELPVDKPLVVGRIYTLNLRKKSDTIYEFNSKLTGGTP